MSEMIPGEEWRGLQKQSTPSEDEASSEILRRARDNIERLRKGTRMLRLIDARERPLAHVPVEIELRRHRFLFGCEVWELDAMIRDGRGASDRARAWKRRFRELFNASTNLCYWTERPRNDASKTEDQQGDPRLDNFVQTVEWSLAEGLTPKGHPLFWSIPKCIPAWLRRYDTSTFMKFAEVRVRNLVARFRGRIRLWDAVNEALWEPAPVHLARRAWPHIEPISVLADYIAEVLRWCREEDPDAVYLINDYGLEGGEDRAPLAADGSRVTPARQRQRFLALVEELERRGAPPDALGLQSHTAGWVTPAQQWESYEDLAQAGRPLHITEFWAALSDAPGHLSQEELQTARAEYVIRFMTCAFGHPAVEAFFFWGFMGEAIRWVDDLSGHEPTILYERVFDLFHREWHTRERGVTDADGRILVRGFHGEYAVRRLDGAAPQGRTFRIEPKVDEEIVVRF